MWFFKKKKTRTVCYILITCGEIKPDGKMDVEMKYEGKRYLASYMLQTGLKILEKE